MKEIAGMAAREAVAEVLDSGILPLIDQKVQESTAHHYGLIKEEMRDMFNILQEGQQNIFETMNREF